MQEHYELLYIISIKFVGEEQTKIVNNVNDLLKTLEAEVTHEEDLGKKRFAYPINHEHQGIYILAEFNLAKDKLKELENKLKLMKEIIRFMIIKKRIKTKEEIKKEQAIEKKLLKEKEEELNKLEEQEGKVKKTKKRTTQKEEVKEKIEPIKEEQPTKQIKETEKETKKKPEEKTSTTTNKGNDNKLQLDDLDKKLDEILNKDIL